MAKRSVIKCSKCGYESNILADTCIKCEGKLDKICGECGFKNSPFKNFCDQCGNAFAITSPPEELATHKPEKPIEKKTDLEIQSISDTMSDETASNTGRIKKSPDKAPAKKHPSAPHPYIPGRRVPVKKKNSLLNIFIITGLSAALLFVLYLTITPHIPKIKLLIKTKKYLTQLSKGNYKEAYKMLSSNSQSSCNMETYIQNTENYYSKRPKWRFKEIKALKINKKTALIKYKLKEGKDEWKDDYISFVKEGDTWARPYIWNIFKPIDNAFAISDFSTALYLAQKLNLIDPLDPRTWGYLCSAEYNLGLYDKAVNSCKKTLEISEIYPVGFNKTTKAWFYFQLANSLKFTKNYNPAFKIYRNLLSDKTSSKLEQCQILLNRSDAYAEVKKYNDALKDILAAQTICPANFQNDLKTFFGHLTGTSKEEAVSFAQKSRFKTDMPTIAELRKMEIADTAKRLGRKNRRFLPKDTWSAIHIIGPEYRVFLREVRINPLTKMKETKNLRIFKVNLWLNSIILEKG